MSYIVEEPLLRTHLTSWAQDNRILVLTFFFWKAGAEEQRNINGLLRSLLYQLLAGLPSLAEWLPNTGAGNVVWTEKRLQNTLEILLDHKPKDASICLFIDGLDEFEGHEDAKDTLIGTIKNLTCRHCIKAVVSSRPEPFLVETFSRYSFLRLQDLTRSDMLTFVREKLLDEHRMRELRDSNRNRFNNFVNAIMRKAEGVFLWLNLAMQDLIRGVRGRDTMDMLESRLASLNRSLDGLFSQLISRIDNVHQALGANYLRLVCLWNSGFSHSPKHPTILHLLFAFDSQFSNTMELIRKECLDDSSISGSLGLIEDLTVALPLRTGGLLEIQETSVCRSSPSDFDELAGTTCSQLCATRPNTNYGALVETYIHFYQHTTLGFVHRSAYEYITEHENGRTLLSKALPLGDAFMETLQRSCERCIQSTMFFVDTPWYLRYVEDEELEAMLLNAAISRDFQLMFAAFKSLEKSRHSASRETYFQSVRAWLATGVGERVKSIRKAKLLSADTFWSAFSENLIHADVVDNEHILTMMLIQTDYYEWASQTMDETHSTSVDYYMKCALQRDLLWNKPDPETPQPWNGLEFVGKLLGLGLQPNSRRPPITAEIPGAVGVQPLSHWQHLLAKAISLIVDNDSTPDPHFFIRYLVLATADIFVEIGADPNARILACHTAFSPPPADLTIVAVVSPLWAISYLARRLDDQGRATKDAMIERGAEIYCSVISVCERTHNVEAKDDTAPRLSFFEESGESEVGTWIRGSHHPFWDFSQDLTKILKTGLEVPNPPFDFIELARRVWCENLDKVENLKPSDRELFMAMRSNDNLAGDSKPDW